jgi:hypothetical protein
MHTPRRVRIGQGPLRQRDHLFGFGTNRIGFSLGGFNALVAEQGIHQVAPQQSAVIGIPPQVLTGYFMSHDTNILE